MKRIILATTCFLPFAALAAGPFDGPYLGAYAGYGWAEDKGIGHMQNTGAVNGWTHKPEPKGALFGLMGGYNWQLNNGFVLGIEADLEGRSGYDDKVYQKDDGVTDTDFKAASRIKSAASLRGRVGYAVTREALVFATAGYAYAKVDRTWYDLTIPVEKESHSNAQGGWTAGLGLDYALNDKLSARLEYRHTDYGTQKVKANLWGEIYKQDLREDTLRIGLNYQF